MAGVFTMEMFSATIARENDNEKHYFIHTNHGHFKYYIVEFEGGTAYARRGRIWAAPTGISYPSEKARKKMKEKLRKGYREILSEEDLAEYCGGL